MNNSNVTNNSNIMNNRNNNSKTITMPNGTETHREALKHHVETHAKMVGHVAMVELVYLGKVLNTLASVPLDGVMPIVIPSLNPLLPPSASMTTMMMTTVATMTMPLSKHLT